MSLVAWYLPRTRLASPRRPTETSHLGVSGRKKTKSSTITDGPACNAIGSLHANVEVILPLVPYAVHAATMEPRYQPTAISCDMKGSTDVITPCKCTAPSGMSHFNYISWSCSWDDRDSKSDEESSCHELSYFSWCSLDCCSADNENWADGHSDSSSPSVACGTYSQYSLARRKDLRWKHQQVERWRTLQIQSQFLHPMVEYWNMLNTESLN